MLDSSAYHTAFPDASEFLDAEPLRLSDHAGLDDFDFLLDDDEGAFADSRGSSDLEALLSDSKGSAAMMECESLSGSLNQMRVDAPPQGTQRHDLSRSLPPQRRRRLSNARRSFHVGTTLDFDPPVQGHQRQMSHGDLTMTSYAAPRRASEHQGCGPAAPAQGGEPTNYNKALQRLAESMRRTELSRDVVMAQRRMLSPEQQLALSSAKEQLTGQPPAQSTMQPQPSPQVAPQATTTPERDISPGQSSIVAQFFSGSRGTLTNGLEQSRRQLGAYMGQVNRVNSSF